MKKIFLTILLIFSSFPVFVYAHNPVIENINGKNKNNESEISIKDPTKTSTAIYGKLEEPGEVDVYKFKAEKNDTLPIEVLVPKWSGMDYFAPSFVFFEDENEIIKVDTSYENRNVFHEPFSFEYLYHGNETNIEVSAGKTYYVKIFSPENKIGYYTLAIGTIENFSDTSFLSVLKNISIMKLGLSGVTNVPWLDIVGMFLFIAGFIIGLGATTVIDFHGFFGRKSSYWTEATIRTHKITKPLIWFGLMLFIIGGLIFHRNSILSGVAFFQLLIFIPLVLNGMFLSFKISPMLLKKESDGLAKEILSNKIQRKIMLSFIISFLCWWSEVFLLVWYLVLIK